MRSKDDAKTVGAEPANVVSEDDAKTADTDDEASGDAPAKSAQGATVDDKAPGDAPAKAKSVQGAKAGKDAAPKAKADATSEAKAGAKLSKAVAEADATSEAKAGAKAATAADATSEAKPGAKPSKAAPPSPGFVERIGLAVVHPRWAFAVAGDRRHAGRSGSDLIVVCLVLVLATQLTKLYGAAWIGMAIDGGLGLRGATDVLTRTLALDLAFLLLGALGLWAAAGARRNLGRAFDLACSAALPLFIVDLVMTTAVRGLGIDYLPRALMWVFSGIAWSWTGALLALALRQAKVASSKLPVPPPAIVARGRLAGRGVLAVAALGLVIQLVWLARHVEDLRPMRDGDPAPQLALPTIGTDGTLGKVVDLATLRGQVVVVDFWATWCKPCIDAMPALESVARKPGVRVLAVNVDDAERAYAMYGTKDLRMTLLFDNDDAQARYGVMRFPHTVVIDRDGMVRTVFRGSGNVAPAVDRLLK